MKAKTPDKSTPKRLKCFVYGEAGCGKTTLLLRAFPQAVVIDTEHGCDQYHDLIRDQGSALLQTNDFMEISEELRALLTESHEYRSVILDPITVVYQGVQDYYSGLYRNRLIRQGKVDQAEMEEFGFAYWGVVKRNFKRIMTLLAKLDMNVAMTAHQKNEYASGEGAPRVIGTTFDSIKGQDYFFDIVFSMVKRSDKRELLTMKQRSYPKPTFPDRFEADHKLIREAWGEEILDKVSEPIKLATKDQIKKLEHLLENVRIADEVVQKWLDKEQVETWAEFSRDNLEKCIKYLEKKLKANGSN